MKLFFKYGWWILLFVAVALGLARLRFDVDILDLLPPDEPSVQGLKLYQKYFTNARELIVTLHAPDSDTAEKLSGELALLGNGKLYGGPFEIFPGAVLDDGRLDACVFPSVNFPSLVRLAPGFIFRRKLSEQLVRRLRADKFELTSETAAAFELDGEWVGNLPATFSIEPKKLRVVIP